MPQKKPLSHSYDLYVQACALYGATVISEEEYEAIATVACKKLNETKQSLDKHPYIVYNIEGVYVKFKRLESNVEINFFSKELYHDIISKYKEG